MDRTLRLSLLYSVEEKEMLHAISKEEGLRPSDVVRRLIREKYATLAQKGKTP